jgi:hypothetical protein
VSITACCVDDQPYPHYDPAALTVSLPDTNHRVRVKVTLTPH